MQAIILAAGEGKRMRPLTLEKPKPLIEIAGKPLLQHVVETLPQEVDELLIIVGYQKEQIQKFFGSNFGGRPVRYIIQEEPRGTHHALLLAEPCLSRDRFLVVYADDLQDAHAMRAALGHERCLLVAEHPEAHRFGVVDLNPDNTIASIVEKPERPPTNLVSTGAMVLDRSIFSYRADQHPNGEYYLTSALNKMFPHHAVHAMRTKHWFPVATPDDILRAESFLKRQNES